MNPIHCLRQSMLNALACLLAHSPASPHGETATAIPLGVAPRLSSGDIILVRTNSWYSRAISLLTGSRWSHVAICIRDSASEDSTGASGDWIIEADVLDGVRRVSLAEFAGADLRVIRPMGLDAGARASLVAYLLGRIGSGYDLEHILSLTWLLVAQRLGSSRAGSGRLRAADPARAICSTLVAHALQAAGLPLAIERPIACIGRGLSLDHLVPGDFEHATGMTTVFDSRLATGCCAA